jgi:hypothetical protein
MVGDPLSLRGALTRCVGVKSVTIPGDQLDTGPSSQPPRAADRRAIGQDVDHRPALEVDRDRAIVEALLRRPLVKSDDPRCQMIGQTLAAEEMTQNSRSIAGKAQACGETFARPPTNPVTQQAQNTGRTLRVSRTRIDYPRQSLGEDGLAAFRVPTLPSTDRERDPHRSALDRQVPQPPLIRAMSRRRDDLTSWTRRFGAELSCFNNPDAINHGR